MNTKAAVDEAFDAVDDEQVDAITKISPELQKALDLYWALTKRQGTQVRIQDVCPWSRDYTIKDAITLDPTEITARMTVENMALTELDSRAIPLRALLEGDPDTQRQLDAAGELIAHLRSPELIEPVVRFRESIAEALKRYGALDETTQAMIDDVQDLAPIRLSALKNMGSLKEFQFLRGAYDPDAMAPVYYQQVFLFWNVNSLLETAAQMKSGVMVALVKEPKASFSYFVFAVRNGANIYLLTDRPDHPHPEYRNMTRRPERRLADRINAGFFPYDLLDYQVDDDGKIFFAQSTDLVVYQKQATPMKPICELAPEERIWIALMFDLLVYRYWHERRQLPELCYTGEMIRTPGALLEKVADRLPVVIEKNPGIEAPTLTAGDVKLANLTSDFSTPPVGHNQWMEELYGDDIPESILNPILDDSRAKLRLSMAEGAGPVAVVLAEADRDAKQMSHLSIIRPDDFGTREQMLSDRRWVARRNAVQVIRARARDDFDANMDHVKDWFEKAVQANAKALLEQVQAGSLVEMGIERSPGFTWGWTRAEHNMLKLRVVHGVGISFTQAQVTLAQMTQADLREGRQIRSGCAVTGQRASVQAIFTPTSPHGLSLLTATPVEQLPKWLQHWATIEPYTGNSILDRLDPLDTVKNPWMALGFRVAILLSKSALKQMGLRIVEVPGTHETYSSRHESNDYVARIGDSTNARFPGTKRQATD